MIISASYRTDIPAFYGRWFMNRLAAGGCRVVNPYGGQVYDVDLSPDSVDGLVFWTKNIGPFLGNLPEIRNRGYPFAVQYTINGYPRALETSVTDPARSIGHMKALRRDYGPRAAVWRYDPVAVTSLTPLDWHRTNFARLAARLAGQTDEVVTSFADLYRKTRRNMAAAARAFRFSWRDPDEAEKRTFVSELAAVAADHGMRLTVCSHKAYTVPPVTAARCIDAGRLSDLAGRPIDARVKGNRPDCQCHASRDIGAYDTCPHGCVYCYAVQHRGLAARRHRGHDAAGPFLDPPAERAASAREGDNAA